MATSNEDEDSSNEDEEAQQEEAPLEIIPKKKQTSIKSFFSAPQQKRGRGRPKTRKINKKQASKRRIMPNETMSSRHG
jgi:hypothetical protein